MANDKAGSEAEGLEIGLIAVIKDKEILNIHPSCVEAHIAVGWKVIQ